MPERKLSEFKTLPEIWGAQSPAVKEIAHKYERSGLHKWDNARVSRLARGLGMTVWVLCAHAGVFKLEWDEKRDMTRLVLDKNRIKAAWRENLWPPFIAVNLERLERCLILKNEKRGQLGTLVSIADRVAAKMLAGTLKHG